ncbi:Glu/Leu/Phe/Val dehydrogenase dimerization domain-containing protein [Kineosporia succinea]|uniref:Leucine dehydrogenase n=1 Tax=Kineosporia succinea TaxID=84632 RepID=A0ABT9PC74_9ACTN|nr:Glu/Leu/Phe/Val dehydrogenase dimerization domain-containing protein [Kineosporia succinea]MDP9830303.1 leucine dehydrogenase [Kineosporia succinea]
MHIDEVVHSWPGRLCCSRFDEETGAFLTIAVDSTQRGPAAGGTRAMVYESFGDAVRDATRLASSMTSKMVAAGLPMGGGKSVIALPVPRAQLEPEVWQRILDRHAENLAMLNGSYFTGPDIGTGPADMDVLHQRCGFAFGRSEQAGGPGSSAPETAHGVYVAVRAAAREAGMPELDGATVVVQGLGAVGMDVARRLAGQGARLVAADVDALACERAADELGARIIGVDDVLGFAGDVFVPCAVGNMVDDVVASGIDTRVVAGAANNVLASDSAARVLSRRGIVYAPDFVANGGGAIHLIGREVLGWGPEKVAAKVEDIAHTLERIFRTARALRISTDEAAHRLVRESLDQAAA